MSYTSPNPNGQATKANSSPVVIASDQSAVPAFISDPTSLVKASVSATGAISVGVPATTVFNDPLNGTVIDTTNRWNSPITAGSGTLTQNGTSGLVFGVGTTANNAAQISSQPTFDTSGAIQYIFALGVQLEATTITTGNHRFWGLGNQGTVYSTTNPIKEGVGFEITTGGVLRAVIYSADAVTFSQNLTIPVDGNEHLYGVFFLGNYMFWYIDQFSIPAAVSGLLQPSNTILPIRLHSLNGGSTTVGTPTYNAFSMAIVDSTRNGINITDGTYAWRKATVSAGGALLVSSAGIPSSLGQQAAATSQPVTLSNENIQDLFFTGQAAQTSAVNNIIPAAVSANATDLTGYRSASIQIICPAGTYTTGAIIFEGSNDNANFVTIPVWNQLILTGTPIAAAITLVTTTFIIYTFPVTTRYVRVRISTAVTGASASVQAVSKFSQTTWVNPVTQIAQATAANLATTATIASGTVTTLTTLSNGQTAHSSASTGSPLRVAGRVLPATPDLTLVAGDASDMGITTGQQLVVKPFSSSELDFTFAGSIVASTTASVFKNAAGASIRNFVTGITLNSDTLTAATEVVIKDNAIAFASQTIASNIITSSATHDLKIGDQFVASASTITGLTAGTVYYVLTVPSATTLTLSATPNGSTLAISGTGVTATANRILFRTKLQTTSFGPTQFTFNTPLRGAPNGTMDIQTVASTVAGAVYYNIQGYTGF